MIEEEIISIPVEELRGAAPLDPSYRLRGESGSALVAHVLSLMASREARQRKLHQANAELRRLTVEVLLANLVVSALHSICPHRPVAVSFHKPRYAALSLSHAAMTLARDTLLDAGLIAHRQGYFQKPVGKDLRECRRAARLRASGALRELLHHYGIDRRTVFSMPTRLIKLNKPAPGVGDEPVEVTASETTLARINARIDAADLAIPDEVWDKTRHRTDMDAEDDPTRFYQGDQTAKSLRRVFTYDWQRGGRIYGGWWQRLSGSDRPLLTIDGEPAVEIDFRNLHPLLLYTLTGHRMEVDPYDLPPYSRDLCKETFQRLMNRAAHRGGADIKRPKDHAPPEGISFGEFLKAYKRHLGEVQSYFGKGIGLILQRVDSDLATAILDELDRQGVVALPVHDSFIVKVDDRAALEGTMTRVFIEKLGVKPDLKTTWPTGSQHQQPPSALPHSTA